MNKYYTLFMEIVIFTLVVALLFTIIVIILYLLHIDKDYQKNTRVSSIKTRKGKLQRLLIVIALVPLMAYVLLNKLSYYNHYEFAIIAIVIPLLVGVFIALQQYNKLK